MPTIFDEYDFCSRYKEFPSSIYRQSGGTSDVRNETLEMFAFRTGQPGAKALVSAFRVTAGERVAEFRQRERVAYKLVAVTRGISRSDMYARMTRKCLAGTAPTLNRTAQGVGLSVARKVIQLLGESKASQPNAPKQQESNPSHKSGQFLALLNEEEAQLAWELFNRGEIKLEKVVSALGQVRALQFLNRLGWAELGAVLNSKVKATHEALALGKSIAQSVDRADHGR